MLVVSLTTLVQEAVSSPEAKHLGADVHSAADLLKEENLKALDANHKGIFAFLAFHPATDKAIVNYVQQGSLPSDSGPNIMVIFTLDSRAISATPLSPQAFGSWATLDTSEHPAYQLLRFLFKPKTAPPLPGVAFLPQLTGEHQVVYVSLQGLPDTAAVSDKVRSLFSLANHTFQQLGDRPKSNFTDRFAVELQKNKVPFEKSGPHSLMEWVVQGYQFVGAHVGDLVAVAQLGAGL